MIPEVRTRIAPSPTGDPHLGTAYIALFNMCFAKKHGGKFILRIEDTDRERSTKESEKKILNALNWLGIEWDEGPDKGGEFGPYRQSERQDIYKQYALKLVNEQKAFYCFCDKERLDKVRAQQSADGHTPKYDGHCLSLTAEQINENLKNNKSFVIRMKVPTDGICKVEDLLRGTVEIPWDRVDMQILLKADGWPTYFLANVVDDHLMKITHVLRGEEWLPSAPKVIKLYEYFNFPLPTLVYMPLLRNADKSKLSKRKNPTSVLFYQKMGFLAQSLLNYLGRMGYSLPNEKEVFGIDEMIESFDIKRISLGGPIFDIEKLSWLNGQYIRNLTDEQFIQEFNDWAFDESFIKQVTPFLKERVELFSDVAPIASFLLTGNIALKPDDFDSKNLSNSQIRQFLQLLIWKLDELRDFSKDNALELIKSIATSMEIKFKDVMPIIFVAITGQKNSFSVLDSMVILGLDLTRHRLRSALNMLGGASKKETKEWLKIS